MRSFSGLLAGWIVAILLVTGCKDGGPTGPDPNSPSEENISASFEGDGSFVPGQFGEITIEGTSLSSDVYDATINDTEIELSSGPEDTTDSETLLFITPALPAGTHQMDITIDDQSTSLDVTIEEYEAINEPSEYIDGYISTIKSRLDTYSSDTDSDELKSWLEDILTNLSSSAENISNLDGPRMQQLAYILRENISIKSDELPATPKGCNEAQNRIDTSAGVPEEILILLKWGSANSLPGYDQTGNTVIVNLTLGAFADPVAQVQAAYAVALKQCISEPVTQLEKAEQLKEKPTYTQLAETQSLDFFPGQSEAFYIRSTFTPPGELLIAIENFLASQEPLMEFIPESVRTYFLEPPEELTQMRDPELFNIENISLGSVQHTQETDGDEILLAFSYKQGQDPDEPQIFTFELADQENPDYPAQVEANLDVNDFDINLEFEGGQSDFLPGRLAVINQEAVTLDKESYDGLIDGEQLVDLAASEDGDNQLLFPVPELSEGQHTLKIRLAGRKVSIDFSVKSYQPIDDPATYTNDIIDQTDSQLETIQNDTENQQVVDHIQQVRNDLADSRSEFKELSAEKKKMVARTIKTNIESFTDNISSKAVTASFDAEKCTDLAGVLIGEKILIERGLKAIIATSSTSIVFGPVAAAVVAGVGIGKFMQSTQKVLDTYQEALDACLSDPVRTLQEDLANAKSAKTAGSTLSSTTLSFIHDESKDFYVQTTYTVFEEIRIAYNDYLALLDPLFEYLPGEWKSKLENSKTELTQVDDPGRFSISGINKSSISAEIQSKSEQIDLTFSYKQGQMPDSRQSFSFILNDSELPDSPTTFEAILEPVNLPKVADQIVTINKNETYKGELTGESTDKFEIVETVQYGELSLDDAQAGNFTYTPAENLVTKEDHPDSFTYRGINNNGADTAKVTIEVVDNTPVAYDDEISLEINSHYDGTLRADNADEFVIVDQPDHGELDLNQVNGDFRYTFNDDYFGEDEFSFKAINGIGESNIAIISISVVGDIPKGTIYYANVHYNEGNSGFFKINPDGSDKTQLFSVDNEGDEFRSYNLNEQEDKVVATIYNPQNAEHKVYGINLSNSTKTRLDEKIDQYSHFPVIENAFKEVSWAPDGNSFVFSRREPAGDNGAYGDDFRKTKIIESDLNGSFKELFSSSKWTPKNSDYFDSILINDVTYSSTGKMAFAYIFDEKYENNGGSFQELRTLSSVIYKITDINSYYDDGNFNPGRKIITDINWSNDSQEITWVLDDPVGYEETQEYSKQTLFAASADGSNRRSKDFRSEDRHLHRAAYGGPYWSPNDEYIVFSEYQSARSEFVTYILDSITLNTVHQIDGYMVIDWSPDGEWIIATSGPSVWIVKIDGTKEIRIDIPEHPNNWWHLDWR